MQYKNLSFLKTVMLFSLLLKKIEMVNQVSIPKPIDFKRQSISLVFCVKVQSFSSGYSVCKF